MEAPSGPAEMRRRPSAEEGVPPPDAEPEPELAEPEPELAEPEPELAHEATLSPAQDNATAAQPAASAGDTPGAGAQPLTLTPGAHERAHIRHLTSQALPASLPSPRQAAEEVAAEEVAELARAGEPQPTLIIQHSSGQRTNKAHAAVGRAVSLGFLDRFAAAHRGTARSWAVKREFLAPEDGGGGSDAVVVTRETLALHRAVKRRAELAHTGKPVAVRYVEIPFELMYTTDVVESFVRPVARAKHRSYAEAEVPAESVGEPQYFASHAWERPFVELVDGLLGDLEGAALEDTYVWLDIFAINQDDSGGSFSAMEELDDGRTLARVIELSRATKVVLDRVDVYALTRLWCLYEIGATPPHKLHLVTRGFSERDIAHHLQSIDAETALCFSDDDRRMIHAEIADRFEFGSLARFTEELRLRFLLRPLSYDADITALRQRSSGEVFQFDALREHIDAAAAVAAAAPQVAAAAQGMRLACVVGEAGEGKSTLSAALLGPFGGGRVHAAHFCKRADAARQDPLTIIQSLAFQLSARFEEIRSCILSIEPAKAQEAQVDATVALEELLVQPLLALAASQRSAVVLIDALDEADGEVINRVLNLLRDIRKADTGALSLIVTMRPVPHDNLKVLSYDWGEAQTRQFAPADLRRATASRAEEIADPHWAAALQLHDTSKIYRVLALELLRRSGADVDGVSSAPPQDVNAAYRCFFDEEEEAGQRDEQVQLLLGIVMSAYEPLSSAHLDELGLLSTCKRLPGWGLLFEERDHLLQQLHLSLREFLTDEQRSGWHVADVIAGHLALARSSIRILKDRDAGPTLAYALKYGHVHLTEVVSQLSATGEDFVCPPEVREWMDALLEPRPPDPPAEQAAALAGYELSPWQARGFCASWLLRQATHGRSKMLVPELLALEASLGRCEPAMTDEPREPQLQGLLKLTTDIRWGMGSFWAPRYDASAETAKALFVSNFPVTSALHDSHVQKQLGSHRMCLPPRLNISPTIHEMLGHSGDVNSVSFDGTGSRIVSGSEDTTVRVWDVATGACVQTLEGHSGDVNSVSFDVTGSRILSGSEDKTVRVWDVATGACVQTLEGHSSWVTSVSFDGTGSRIVSGSDDKTVRVWDVAMERV